MTKESKYNIDHPRLIFRETFADEQSVRRNGGTPTNVTFSKGVGEFNGSSSFISNTKRIFSKDQFSVLARIRTSIEYVIDSGYVVGEDDGTNRNYVLGVNVTNEVPRFVTWIGGSAQVATGTTSTNDAEWHIIVGTFGIGGTKVYLDGSLEGTDATTGVVDDDPGSIAIGARNGATQWFNGDIDLIEIYNYQLTAEEVANMAGV